jgi:hypothetical protein
MPRSQRPSSKRSANSTKNTAGDIVASPSTSDSAGPPSARSADTSVAPVSPPTGNALVKRKIGRPALTKAPEPFASEILAWISKGKTLLAYCEQKGKPARQTITGWFDIDEEFRGHYKAAREIGFEAMFEQCGEIADIEPETPVQAAWRRYQIDTKLKILRMANPAKYGEKVAVDHGGGITLNVITGVPDGE